MAKLREIDLRPYESRLEKWSRRTMKVWMGLSLFALFALVIALPGSGQIFVATLFWWETSHGVLSLSLGLTATIILLGSASVFVGETHRPRLAAASACAFTITGHILGTSSASTTLESLVELVFLHAPLGLALLWLLVPPRSRKPGHCTKCGYYLKGINSDRCPECGESIAAWAERF